MSQLRTLALSLQVSQGQRRWSYPKSVQLLWYMVGAQPLPMYRTFPISQVYVLPCGPVVVCVL